jgi:fructoselysine-6-P-deglycase FrlB-like protein
MEGNSTDVVHAVLLKHAMHVLGVTERLGYPQAKFATHENDE